MLRWLRRRRLSEASERRLLIALARAQDELIRTHVQNALDVMEAVADDLQMGRALALYIDEMELEEPQSTIIAQRVLARLEEEDE